MGRRFMYWLLVAGALGLAGCSTVELQQQQPARAAVAGGAASPAMPAAVGGLRHLGTRVVARADAGLMKDFGGISGLDRDPATGTWYLLSDDRSDRAPARVYEARIEVGDAGFGRFEVSRQLTLQQQDGTPYPGSKAGGDVPDPESVRVDPLSGELVWSSEGDRGRSLDPFVRIARRDGSAAGLWPLPGNFKVTKEREEGVRNNLAIEGLAFAPDGQSLWAAMEGPLYQDGTPPTLQSGALARITRIGRNGRVLAQYAYPLDPIQLTPTGGKKRGDNGISEILVLGNNHFLVVERSGYEVDELVFRFAVRLYEAWADTATDVAGLPALKGATVVPMTKRLLLDLNKAGLGEVDNIEAAAWGPRLPNGHATLVLASDDNFSPRQVNQFMAFEVLP